MLRKISGTNFFYIKFLGRAYDLVLIDQHSVGKGSLHLMDTVKTKKRCTTIFWRVDNF
jgi:hypothetical protein